MWDQQTLGIRLLKAPEAERRQKSSRCTIATEGSPAGSLSIPKTESICAIVDARARVAIEAGSIKSRNPIAPGIKIKDKMRYLVFGNLFESSARQRFLSASRGTCLGILNPFWFNSW